MFPGRLKAALEPGLSAAFQLRVKDVDLRTVNELFLLTQPAHLQKIQGKKMEGDVRRAARADFIRTRLNGK